MNRLSIPKSLLAAFLAVGITAQVALAESLPVNNNPASQVTGHLEAQAAPITEDNAMTMIRVDKAIIPMKSKLKKQYVGYKVTVSSDYPGTLKLMSGSITNGFPGVAAYNAVEVSKANMWWSALLGLAGIVVIGLPTLAVISSKNHHAENESSQFSNQIPLVDFQKGGSISFNALTAAGQTPQLNLSFKDPKTGLEFSKTAQ